MWSVWIIVVAKCSTDKDLYIEAKMMFEDKDDAIAHARELLSTLHEIKACIQFGFETPINIEAK